MLVRRHLEGQPGRCAEPRRLARRAIGRRRKCASQRPAVAVLKLDPEGLAGDTDQQPGRPHHHRPANLFHLNRRRRPIVLHKSPLDRQGFAELAIGAGPYPHQIIRQHVQPDEAAARQDEIHAPPPACEVYNRRRTGPVAGLGRFALRCPAPAIPTAADKPRTRTQRRRVLLVRSCFRSLGSSGK